MNRKIPQSSEVMDFVLVAAYYLFITSLITLFICNAICIDDSIYSYVFVGVWTLFFLLTFHKKASNFFKRYERE